MVKDNQFHQYGYNHYLKAPARAQRSVNEAAGLRLRLLRKANKPFIAVVAVVSLSVLLAGVIFTTYSSGDEVQKPVPIIKADLRPIKTLPAQRGGMDIQHRDSTILADIGGSGRSELGISMETHNVENLLLRSNNDRDTLIDKEAAIEQAMAQKPDISINKPIIEKLDLKPAFEVPAFEVKEPVAASEVLQKIGSSSDEVSSESDFEFDKKVASAAISSKPDTTKFYAAAAAPETLEFVRGILNKSEQGVNAKDVASISPAAGVGAVSYFVQLASIKDAARAGAEWSKMSARYDVLSNSKFRVQEASLPGGKFYRIQAGPMSKPEATKLCDALKAQGKAGGCLVVK